MMRFNFLKRSPKEDGGGNSTYRGAVVVNTNPTPTGDAVYESETPTGKRIDVKPNLNSFTVYRDSRPVNTKTVYGTYWLNPPYREAALRIRQVYKQILPAVTNYDRTHHESFFDAYPDFLILQSDSEGQVVWPDTKDLKRDVRKHVKALAHVIHYFETIYTAWLGSYLNMEICNQLNTDYAYAGLATAFRVSNLNAINKRFTSILQPKGLVDYMVGLTRFAVGTTDYGAPIRCLPMWICDVYASRNYQALSPSALVALGNNGSSALVSGLELPKGKTTDAELRLVHEYITAQCYSSWAYSTQRKQAFAPFVENSATTIMRADVGQASERLVSKTDWHARAAGPKLSRFPSRLPNGCRDNIVDTYYETYEFWEECLRNPVFQIFQHPEQEYTKVLVDEWKLFDNPITLDTDIRNKLRSNQRTSMKDLSKKMVYKQNKVTTSHYVRLSLPIPSDLNSQPEKAKYTTSNVFAMNWERYPVDNLEPNSLINAMREWPTISPVYFRASVTDSTIKDVPLVQPDIGPAYGCTLGPDTTVTPFGFGAAAIDSIHLPMGAGESSIEFACVDTSFADQITETNATLISDCANTLLVDTAPLIDCTDLNQCGFNVLISYDGRNGNEWEAWLGNSDNYYFNDTQDNHMVNFSPDGHMYYGAVTPTGAWTLPHLLTDTTACLSDPKYIEHIGHALVFVGKSIFTNPRVSRAFKSAGIPTVYYYSWFDEATPPRGINDLDTIWKGLDSSGVADPLLISEGAYAVQLSLAGAGMPSIASINRPDRLSSSEMFADWVYKLASHPDCAEQAFSGMYGPVAPFTYEDPFADLGFNEIYAADMYSDHQEYHNYPDSFVKPRKVYVQNGTHLFYDAHDLVTARDTSVYFYMPFLSQVQLFPTDEEGIPYTENEVRLVYLGQHHWAFNFMSKVVVSNPQRAKEVHLEDFIDRMVRIEETLVTDGADKQDNTIVPPRTIGRSRNSDPSYSSTGSGGKGDTGEHASHNKSHSNGGSNPKGNSKRGKGRNQPKPDPRKRPTFNDQQPEDKGGTTSKESPEAKVDSDKEFEAATGYAPDPNKKMK